MVYFNLIISSDVDPPKIIAWTMYEWTRINWQRMQIKDFQDVASETAVTFFKVSTEILKAVILYQKFDGDCPDRGSGRRQQLDAKT
jgi:hypothetical protein